MKTTDQTGQTRQTDPKSCTEECTEDKDAMNQVGRKNKRTR
jgi:hypothetical protein